MKMEIDQSNPTAPLSPIDQDTRHKVQKEQSEPIDIKAFLKRHLKDPNELSFRWNNVSLNTTDIGRFILADFQKEVSALAGGIKIDPTIATISLNVYRRFKQVDDKMTEVAPTFIIRVERQLKRISDDDSDMLDDRHWKQDKLDTSYSNGKLWKDYELDSSGIRVRVPIQNLKTGKDEFGPPIQLTTRDLKSIKEALAKKPSSSSGTFKD